MQRMREQRQDRPLSPADYDIENHYDNPEHGWEPVSARAAYPFAYDTSIMPYRGYGAGRPGVDYPADRSRRVDVPYADAPSTRREPYVPVEAWREPGPHTGRGPQGYRRLDARIFEDVAERMMLHGHLDASNITVYVAEGVVTLTGSVDSRRAKRIAEEIAEDVKGVYDVRNMIHVKDDNAPQPYTVPSEFPHQDEDRDQDQANRTRGQTDDPAEGINPALAVQPQPMDARQSYISPIGPGAIPETAPATAVTDDAGLTTLGPRVAEDMTVVGSDQERIGRVKEIRMSDFLVDRPLARDVYVPFEAVQEITEDRVILKIQAAEVTDQGWSQP